jgi:hypothetical protein
LRRLITALTKLSIFGSTAEVAAARRGESKPLSLCVPAATSAVNQRAGKLCLISEAENLLTRRATMFAARFASSYNQSFPNNDGKSATINREIEL